MLSFFVFCALYCKIFAIFAAFLIQKYKQNKYFFRFQQIMVSFLIALAALILGYLIYGKFIASIMKPDPNRQTPCFTHQDGVDYIPMPAWKVFMIQFLNIAGLGPIYGAIMGAQFGTASYLWIVLGTIFAGAVHDYTAAMVSLRHDGESLPETVGRYLGINTKRVMTAFTVVLLILVGAVFVSGPASLLAQLTPSWLNEYVWIVIIFLYYIIATLMPVDKIIGKIYPVFAFCLLFMAVGLLYYILVMQPDLREVWQEPVFGDKYNADKIFPMMFISIACGAISGFHATQSPMMARCLKDERLARPCFYGAMVTEGIVALIWAAAATWFYHQYGAEGATGASVANAVSREWLGTFGAVLAIIGIAVAPITSGDTALRSCRMVIADFFHIKQKSITKRLMISVPIFVITAGILVWSISNPKGFQTLWRYFGWSNQALSVFTLWAVTAYLMKSSKWMWVTFVPAIWMTFVCTTYILVAPEALELNYTLGVCIGGAVALTAAILGLVHYSKVRQQKAVKE